jgi:hypothetical protein
VLLHSESNLLYLFPQPLMEYLILMSCFHKIHLFQLDDNIRQILNVLLMIMICLNFMMRIKDHKYYVILFQMKYSATFTVYDSLPIFKVSHFQDNLNQLLKLNLSLMYLLKSHSFLCSSLNHLK